MKFDRKILIVGASGFGREVLTCLIDVVADSDKKPSDYACFMESEEFLEKTKQIHGIEVIGRSGFDPKKYQVLVGIGNPNTRRKVVEDLPKGTVYATLIHPSAIISKWVEIGEGSIISAGSILTTDIKIGKHAHVNLNTTIGHDCNIGDYFTAAPGVNISGICEIGNSVYFGTNSAIRQGAKVCDNVTMGMGAVVINNITEGGVYVGNPATKIK